MTDASRRRLLIVSVSLSGGGAERFVSTLLGHLDRARFEPTLCLLRGPVTYPLPDDVPVTYLDKTRPWHIPRTIWRLHRLIIRQQPDAILGNMLYTNWLIGAAMFGLPTSGRPYWVARFANSLKASSNRWEPRLRPLHRFLFRRIDRWVGNSRALAEEIIEVFKPDRARVTAIGTPIDLRQIERLAADGETVQKHRPVLLGVGRLDRQKRYDVLLSAFSAVLEKVDCELWILGDGPLRDDLERQAVALRISDRVTFWGFQNNPYKWIAAADIFVLTSDHEGLPNALMEAQALGIPAVSTACPTGPGEIIEHEVTGLLVPPGDVIQVAAAARQLLTDRELRMKMGQAARERMLVNDACDATLRWERALQAFD